MIHVRLLLFDGIDLVFRDWIYFVLNDNYLLSFLSPFIHQKVDLLI